MDKKRNERKRKVQLLNRFSSESSAEKNLPKDQPGKEEQYKLQEEKEGKYKAEAEYLMLTLR